MSQKTIGLYTANLEAGTSPVPANPLIPAVYGAKPGDFLYRAAEWFRLDIANGDARADTIKNYITHLNHWLVWCRRFGIDPGHATVLDVKQFRQELVNAHAAHATISLKLTVIRRFYAGAVERGLIALNPAAGVKAPRNRSAAGEVILCLTAAEAERLLEAAPADGHLKNLRDRAMIGLMMLEGLRRVEICRMCVGDLMETANGMQILVHGKGKDGYIYPREDVAALLGLYLSKRGPVDADEFGEPVFVSITRHGQCHGRITRIGLSKWMDEMMLKAGIAKKGRGCHALRHTCGAQLYQASRDVKVVQETLRHESIAMAARYSHVHERGKARYTQAIPFSV